MKKKKKKLKKKNRTLTSSPSQVSGQTIAASNTTSAATAAMPPGAIFETPATEEVSPEQALVEKYAYVRKDVKKVLMYIGLIVALLIIFYFLNAKTSILSSFGDWIYKITNIQAG